MQEPTVQAQRSRDGSSRAGSPFPQASRDRGSSPGGPHRTGARRARAGSEGGARLLVAGVALLASLLALRTWSAFRAPSPSLGVEGAGQLHVSEEPEAAPLLAQEGGPERAQALTGLPDQGQAEAPDHVVPVGVRSQAPELEPLAFQLEVTVRPWPGEGTGGEVLLHPAGASHETALTTADLDGTGRCRFEGLTLAEETKLACTLRMPGVVQVERVFSAPPLGTTMQLTLETARAEPHAVLLVEEGSGAAVTNTEVVAFWSEGGRRVCTRTQTNAHGRATFRSLPDGPVWFEVRTGLWSSPAVARTRGEPGLAGSGPDAGPEAPTAERSAPSARGTGDPYSSALGSLGPRTPTTVLLARPAASLTGRLLGISGHPLDPPPQGLRVRALDDLGREHHLRAEVTGEGSYRVEGLPVGAVQLLAVAEPAQATSAPLGVDLVPGELHERDLVLRDRMGVRGRVISAASGLPLAGAQVEAHLMVGGAWLPEAIPAVSTDAWGRFEGLSVSATAGAVLIRAQGHDQRASRVEVPSSVGNGATGQGDDLRQPGVRQGAHARGLDSAEPGGSRGSPDPGSSPGRTRRDPAPAVLDLGDLGLSLEQIATLQLNPCPPDAEDWILLQDPPLSFDPAGRLALTASPGPLQVLVQGPGQVPTLVECTLSGTGPWHLRVPAEYADGRLARFHLIGAGGSPFQGASLASTALRIAYLDRDTGVALVQHARPVADGAALIEVRGLPRALMTATLVHAGREEAPQLVDGRVEGSLEVVLRAEVARGEALLLDGEGSPLADFDAWVRPTSDAPPHHTMTDGAGRLHLDPDAPLEHLLLADPVSLRLARLDSVRSLSEGPTSTQIADRLQLALRSPKGPLAHAPLLIGLDPHPAIGALALTSDEEGLSPVIRHGAGPLWLHLPAPGVWRPTRRLDLGRDAGGVLEIEVLRTAAVLVRAIPTPSGVMASGTGLTPTLRHLVLQQSVSDWALEGSTPSVDATNADGEVLVHGVPEGPYRLEIGGASIEVELRHGELLEVEVLLP